MRVSFRGFSREGMDFLRELKENNDREWFTPRKQTFEEQVRLPMIELVRAVHAEMLRFAPRYVGEPAKCVFRIYRDTRFSKDKTPYKTHIAASFLRNAAEKNRTASFYFSVSPEEIEIAGGLYSPEPEVLLAVRRRIAEDPEGFRATFEGAKVKRLCGPLQGAVTARAPKGFDPEDQAIDLIKRKQYCFFVMLDPALATTSKLAGEIVKRFEAMTPLIEWLNGPEKRLVTWNFD